MSQMNPIFRWGLLIKSLKSNAHGMMLVNNWNNEPKLTHDVMIMWLLQQMIV